MQTGPKVVVIGGGATGCGIARDLALRRFAVTLIEFGDLGSGTSSRFHGMLQSGARYAVSDTGYAAECMSERRIIARLAPEAVEQTGGLFVSLPSDPDSYADSFLMQCGVAGIPCEELDAGQVMRQEPAISRNVKRAFAVPDATVQPWRLLNLLADDIRHLGGTILTRHRVTRIDVHSGAVRGVEVSDGGASRYIAADLVVNAAGPWSGRVAAMVGQSMDLELGKGSILVFSHRLTSRAVNRCRPPTSHDIVVPTGTVSLFGTTSEVVDDPDTTHVRPEEIQDLLNNAEEMIPNARGYRAFRAWAGVRPLYRPPGWDSAEPLPRRHAIVEHRQSGVDGFYTICGGSLTTHRAMAEDIGDRICASLALNTPCESAAIPLAGRKIAKGWHPAESYYSLEKTGRHHAPVCECEAVDAADVGALIAECKITHLHDLRRRLRIGFGPCQGTICGARVAAMIAQHVPAYPARTDLGRFWTERLKGARHTAWGPQAKQVLLSDLVYRQSLGIRLTPDILPVEDHR